MAMDVKRDPAIYRRKVIRRWILASLGLVVIIAGTVAVSRLRPAAPTVDAPPWVDLVKRGDMVREVRGSGTLVPEDIRWIPATTSGRVERLVLTPGAEVTPDSVIIEMSNPDLEQAVQTADLALKSAQAAYSNLKANLAVTILQQRADVELADSDLKSKEADYQANLSLSKDKLISDVQLRQTQLARDHAQTQLTLDQNRLKSTEEGQKNQLAPQEAELSRLDYDYKLKLRQLDDLKVKAGMSGVLQLVPVERGQQVGQGTNVARVANPAVLKAVLKVSETQTPDIRIGQTVDVDTRNGHVTGHVSRIDPSAQGGQVGVDVSIADKLPPGARPDLSVDGTIELQRLENVVKVGRPSFGQDGATITLFKVSPDGREAVRTQVKLGRSSVNEFEILEGLKPGDRVILSDMSAYDSFDRVRCACGTPIPQ